MTDKNKSDSIDKYQIALVTCILCLVCFAAGLSIDHFTDKAVKSNENIQTSDSYSANREVTHIDAVDLRNQSDADENYALLHDMLNYSDKYLDKQIMLTGFYSNSLLQADGSLAEPKEDEIVYHFITVFDEPGDCYLTVEFVSSDDTYPESNSEITVTGILQIYKEGNDEYLHLTDSTWSTTEPSSGSSTDNADSANSTNSTDNE